MLKKRPANRPQTIANRKKIAISISGEAQKIIEQVPSGQKSKYISDAIIEKDKKDKRKKK